MKFPSPFILLLGCIFSPSLEAIAIPLNPRQKGIVTLPLKRVPTRQDLHPQLVSMLYLLFARTLYNPHNSSSNNTLTAHTDVSLA